MVLALVSLFLASPAAANWVKTPRLPAAVCTGDQVVKYASGADLSCSADMATQAELDAATAGILPDRVKVNCSAADDTSALTAAIASVSTNGGIVALPAAQCDIASDITVPPKVQLLGVPGTVIKATSGATFTTGMLVFTGQGVRFSDFRCDLNGKAKPCIISDGVTDDTNEVEISRVYVLNGSTTAASATPYVKIACSTPQSPVNPVHCATIRNLHVGCANTNGVNDVGLQIDACDNSLNCSVVAWNNSFSEVTDSQFEGCSGTSLIANGIVMASRLTIDTRSSFTGPIGVALNAGAGSTVRDSSINLRSSTAAYGIKAGSAGKIFGNLITGQSGGNTTIGIDSGVAVYANKVTLVGTGVIGINPAFQSSSIANTVSVTGTGSRAISCQFQCSVGAGNNLVASGTGAIAVSLRGSGSSNVTGGLVIGNMINSSGTDSAGVVCGAQQSEISNNWISGTVGIRPPYVEGAGGWATSEFNGYVNCRAADNLLSFLTIGIEAATGWHIANNTINWIAPNGTGILVGSENKYGTCTGHTLIEGNNLHTAENTVNLIRFTRIGKRCLSATESNDADYLEDCTSTGLNLSCTDEDSDGDGLHPVCTNLNKAGNEGCTGISISNNFFMGGPRSAVDVYSDATAGTQVSEAPDVYGVDVRGNMSIMGAASNIVRFPSTLADVFDFIIADNDFSDVATTPILNWNPGYGWVNSIIEGSSWCREIVNPITNGTYPLMITGKYGAKLMSVQCNCQTNCAAMPTLTVQDRTPTAYGGTTGGCNNGSVQTTPLNVSSQYMAASKVIDLKLTGTITPAQVIQVCVQVQP